MFMFMAWHANACYLCSLVFVLFLLLIKFRLCFFCYAAFAAVSFSPSLRIRVVNCFFLLLIFSLVILSELHAFGCFQTFFLLCNSMRRHGSKKAAAACKAGHRAFCRTLDAVRQAGTRYSRPRPLSTAGVRHDGCRGGCRSGCPPAG